jgi:hypothetical protein
MPAAVVFDLDGVLIDSEPVWEQVRRQVVADHGGRWLPQAQARLMGMSTNEWAHYLSEDLGADLPAAAIADLVISRMADRYTRRLPLLPGAVEAVASAATRWPLALASSSPPRLIEAALSAAGLRDALRVTVSTEEVLAGKPARTSTCSPPSGSAHRPENAWRSRTRATACGPPRPRACASLRCPALSTHPSQRLSRMPRSCSTPSGSSHQP